jgi:predicted DNA-binding protein (MmcQ/YjbR family)
MAKDINQAVREICLWFPEATEVSSHGSPDFRVRDKTFATYVVNHHGDGRIALWLNAPTGAQELYTKAEPEHFFIPPYVGPRGWLGVNLDKGVSWKRVAKLVREAYEKVAPPALARSLGDTIEIKPPTRTVPPEQFDPLSTKRAQGVLKFMRAVCLSLPDTSEATQFGAPVWRVGKKTFASVYDRRKKLCASFWVGPEHQALMTADDRYTIPAYTGHNGWIELDVSNHLSEEEVRELALHSYRRFAAKRTLAKLDEAQTSARSAERPAQRKTRNRTSARSRPRASAAD